MRSSRWLATTTLALVLMAASRAAAAELPIPDPPPGDVQKKATSILAQPQFAPAKKSLMERVFNWIIGKLKIPFTKAAGGNTIIGYLILGAFVAALVVVLSRLRFRLPESVADDEAVIAVEIAENRSPDEWRAEAERFETAGAWKEALRARYRWMIAALIDAQVLVAQPGRTPGEYRRDFAAARPDAADAFATATDLFERAWYGNAATGPDENARFRTNAARVLARAEVRV